MLGSITGGPVRQRRRHWVSYTLYTPKEDAVRHFTGKVLLIANRDPDTVAALRVLLDGVVDMLPAAADVGLDEPDAKGDTFVARARSRALYAARRSRHPAIADDSGMGIEVLGGFPGVLSKRLAERADGTRDFARAMAAVHDKVKLHKDVVAYFSCTLAVAWPDGHCQTAEGDIFGTLVWPPRGIFGFGYDPMFMPDGHTITFGEMSPIVKEMISHRAVAFKALRAKIFRGSGIGEVGGDNPGG